MNWGAYTIQVTYSIKMPCYPRQDVCSTSTNNGILIVYISIRNWLTKTVVTYEHNGVAIFTIVFAMIGESIDADILSSSVSFYLLYASHSLLWLRVSSAIFMVAHLFLSCSLCLMCLNDVTGTFISLHAKTLHLFLLQFHLFSLLSYSSILNLSVLASSLSITVW